MSKKYFYDVSFTFTKVRGNYFSQKNATTEIFTHEPINESFWEDEGLLSALAQSVFATKPKWEILKGSIEIKSMKPLNK